MTRFGTTGWITNKGVSGGVNLMTSAAVDWAGMAGVVDGARGDALKLLCQASGLISAKKWSSSVSRYARRYFLIDTMTEADRLAIKDIVIRTWNGLAGDVAIKVGDLGQGTLGAVSGRANQANTKLYHNQVFYADTQRMERAGAIKLAGSVMSDGYQGVLTLIHEATHKYAGTMDYCYFEMDGRNPEGTFTDKGSALANADSYAWFILKIGRKRFGSYANAMYT